MKNLDIKKKNEEKDKKENTADKTKEVIGGLSDIQDNGNTYKFVQNEEGAYVSNNIGKTGTIANSYFISSNNVQIISIAA